MGDGVVSVRVRLPQAMGLLLRLFLLCCLLLLLLFRRCWCWWSLRRLVFTALRAKNRF